MRKSSKTQENQVRNLSANERTVNAANLRRRQPLTDKTNKNVTNDFGPTKKNTMKSKDIKDTTTITSRMKTAGAKELTTVIQTRTRSQTCTDVSPKSKPAAKKIVVSTKVRTRKSLDKANEQKKKILDGDIKHMKSARVVLSGHTETKNKNRKSKILDEKSITDKSTEISDTSDIRQSARISIRKNNRNSDTIVVINLEDCMSVNKFRKPFAKASVKGRKSNPLAVYEFDYDPKDEPKPNQKRKRGQPKKCSSDSSGEEDNSMKAVVKKLRRLDRKVKQKPNEDELIKKQRKQIEVAKKTKKAAGIKNAKQKPMEVKIKEMFEEIRGKNDVKQTVVVPRPVVIANIEESCLIVPKVRVEHCDKNKSTKEVIEEVANSFLEDDSPDFDDFQPVSPGPINIISNVLVRRSNESVSKQVNTREEQIFNSTMNTTVRQSYPWRLNISTIRKKPHAFTVKDKSFVPSYDQDIIEISNKSTKNTSDETKQHESKVINKGSEKEKNQTSILDFINSSKPRPAENKPVSLFDDLPIRNMPSPRKFLGEINYVQSTPLKPNNSIRICTSPNISVISPKRSDTEESLFGFSFLSDSDNVTKGNKENAPLGKSPRKQKDDGKKNVPTRISLNEIKRVLVKDVPKAVAEIEVGNPKSVHFKETEIPDPDDSDISVALFEDPEDNFRVLKRITKQYVRKHPKRKRLPSVESVENDQESDTELPTKKKAKEKKRTKEEEAEIDRLASYYNAMFAEIEQHPLCIE